MIFLGLDDTDVLDSPGTNKLARHLVDQLQETWPARMITRHQLLKDPRVPCTRKNGCVAMVLDCSAEHPSGQLIERVRPIIQDWCPPGSDPGLCVTRFVPAEIVEFGQRCQRELVSQGDARGLARKYEIYLEGLGGTEDGVIGALAAIGLSAGQNDGRITYLGESETDLFDVSGPQPFDRLLRCGVHEVRCICSQDRIQGGLVDVGKRLRPNLEQGRIVLFVADHPRRQAGIDCWEAVRV